MSDPANVPLPQPSPTSRSSSPSPSAPFENDNAVREARPTEYEEDMKRPDSYASSASASVTMLDDSTAQSSTPKKSPSLSKLNDVALAAQTTIGVVASLPDQDNVRSPSDLEKGVSRMHVEIDLPTKERLEDDRDDTYEGDEKSAPRLSAYDRTARVDPNLVTWDGPDDPANPKNWTMRRKWIVTWTVSLFTLMRCVLVHPRLGNCLKAPEMRLLC